MNVTASRLLVATAHEQRSWVLLEPSVCWGLGTKLVLGLGTSTCRGGSSVSASRELQIDASPCSSFVCVVCMAKNSIILRTFHR